MFRRLSPSAKLVDDADASGLRADTKPTERSIFV
jgi:hypothetical protein